MNRANIPARIQGLDILNSATKLVELEGARLERTRDSARDRTR